MNRKEFLNTLEKCLEKLPADEKNDAINYYRELFDEAGKDNEQQIIEELDSPEKIAAQILMENGITSEIDPECLPEKVKEAGSGSTDTQGPDIETEKTVRRDNNTILAIIIILVLTSPIWCGLAAGILGVTVGLIAAAFSILIGLCGAGIGLIAAGTVVTFKAPPFGLMLLGIGLMLFGVSVLVMKPVLKGLFKLAAWLVNKIVELIRKIFNRKESVQ